MTTNNLPWSISPHNAAEVVDFHGKIVGLFHDFRDAELAASMVNASGGCLDKIKDIYDELEVSLRSLKEELDEKD